MHMDQLVDLVLKDEKEKQVNRRYIYLMFNIFSCGHVVYTTTLSIYKQQHIFLISGIFGLTGRLGPKGRVGQPGPEGSRGPPGRQGSTGYPGKRKLVKQFDTCILYVVLVSLVFKQYTVLLPGFAGSTGNDGPRGGPGWMGILGGQGQRGDNGATGRIGPTGTIFQK